MATTFIVEDGTGKSDANALINVAGADQIVENYGNSSDWSDALNPAKENAIRTATRYMCLHYRWKGYRAVTGQALQWPRIWVDDDEGVAVDIDIVPEKVKEACAYLALLVIQGTTLLEDLANSAKVKKTKDVLGPITEEIEYVHGEAPGTDFQTADMLVAPYTEGRYSVTDLSRG